jgi:hypothetical protein
VWEKNREHCTNSQKVLDLESIDVGIMSGFVLVEHKVDDVGRGTDKEEFEGSEV